MSSLLPGRPRAPRHWPPTPGSRTLMNGHAHGRPGFAPALPVVAIIVVVAVVVAVVVFAEGGIILLY